MKRKKSLFEKKNLFEKKKKNLFEKNNRWEYEKIRIRDKHDWIKKFIFWELEIIKLVGYDIDFNNYIDIKKLNKDDDYISTLDGSKKIPVFLLKIKNSQINYTELKDGLKIVGDYLNKTVLSPNNINFPLSRSEFTKLI